MQKSERVKVDFYDTTNTEDWTDDEGEIRELTRADMQRMTPFDELPEDFKEILRQVKHATIRPDLLAKEPVARETVTLEISRPILERFKARGAGWERNVDAALLEWMEEHKAS